MTIVYIVQKLKMCDVAVPCSNCVRRNRVEFCVAAATTNTGDSRLVLCMFQSVEKWIPANMANTTLQVLLIILSMRRMPKMPNAKTIRTLRPPTLPLVDSLSIIGIVSNK